METFVNSSTAAFFVDLGSKIFSVSGDVSKASFSIQRVSVTVQRFNSVLFRGSFISNKIAF